MWKSLNEIISVSGLLTNALQNENHTQALFRGSSMACDHSEKKSSSAPRTKHGRGKIISGILLAASCAGMAMTTIPGSSLAQGKTLPALLAPLERAPLLAGLLSPAAFEPGQGPTDIVKDVKLMDAQALRSFYEARGNELYWTRSHQDLKRAQDMRALIEQSWTHGLNPEKYHLSQISNLMEDPRGEGRHKLEMLLSDAAMRYARDMSGMRVDAGKMGLRSKYWRQSLTGMEIAQGLSRARDIPVALRNMAPQGELYKKMQAEMVRLSHEEARFDNILPINFGGGLFRPGQSHPDVSKLRAYIGLAYNPLRGPENYYDDSLASAVMDFQYQHNLSPDAIIGPATLTIINRSHKDKMRQLVANLERARWLDDVQPDRYIMVNIPSHRLWAVEKGKIVLDMKVIVGLPTRQTKQFKTEITGVRFNPTWTVPLSLKMADFKPKLIEDPGYLHDKGIQVYQDGRTLDPYAIDWANITHREMNMLRFTQKPGDHNALGRIRILMPSDYDIYLHDTNHPEFFENVNRALSSGCIRMAQPEQVAHFILQDNPDWSDERMKAIIERGRMTEVAAVRPFPVYIIYQSVWLDERGDLVYGPDIYKQDQKLIEELARTRNYALPQAASYAGAGPSKTAALN